MCRYFFSNVVQQHSVEQIISIWEIFRPWKAFHVSESFSGVFGNTVFVSLVNGLEFGPGGLQDDKRVLEDEKNEKKSHHQTDLI